MAKKTGVDASKIDTRFKIENIVASANLGIELDLYSIAQKVRDVEYEPEQFPGAILKLKDPRASLLLFKNGKIICTGSKSEKEVKFALERAVKLLAAHARAKPPEKPIEKKA
jgi:transcription initiation factor TFIID TATA-box-binding protein